MGEGDGGVFVRRENADSVRVVVNEGVDGNVGVGVREEGEEVPGLDVGITFRLDCVKC